MTSLRTRGIRQGKEPVSKLLDTLLENLMGFIKELLNFIGSLFIFLSVQTRQGIGQVREGRKLRYPSIFNAKIFPDQGGRKQEMTSKSACLVVQNLSNSGVGSR